MPTLDYAGGFATGFANSLLAKRQRDQQLQDRQSQMFLDAAHFLISSGRVPNWEEVQPLYEAAGINMDALGGGAKGKGGKGKIDPHQILADHLNPILQARPDVTPVVPANAPTQLMDTGRAAAASQTGDLQSTTPFSAAPPTPPAPVRASLLGVHLMGDEELNQHARDKASADALAAGDVANQVKIRAAAALRAADPGMSLEDSLISVGMHTPRDKFAPLPVGAGVVNTGTGEITEPASAKEPPIPEPLNGRYQDLLALQGLTPGMVADKPTLKLKFLKQAADGIEQEHASDRATKDALAQSLEYIRSLEATNAQGALADLPTATDLQQRARTITVRDKSYAFVSKGDYTGARAQNAATKAGESAGVLVVTPEEADQLKAAQSALANLSDFFDEIKAKLPTTAQGRPFGALSNKLSEYFQTDDALAASSGWQISILPALNALRVSGRIPVQEFQRGLNAQPKITDTLKTAEEKRLNLEKILTNAVNPILQQGGTGKAAANATPKTPTTDAQRRSRAALYLRAQGQPASDANIDWVLQQPGADAEIAAALKTPATAAGK